MSNRPSIYELVLTEDFKDCGYKIVKCPCCGNDTLSHYWICEHCGWEYDFEDYSDENTYSDCNKCTLKAAKEKYLRG